MTLAKYVSSASAMTGATGWPCVMRSRSSAVPRAGSGGSGGIRAMIAQQRGDRDRQGGEDFRRVAVFRQARQREANAFDKGPPARLRQPLAEPVESPHAPGAEPRAHRVAVQPRRRQTPPTTARPRRHSRSARQGRAAYGRAPTECRARRRCGSAPSRRRRTRRDRCRTSSAADVSMLIRRSDGAAAAPPE